MRREPLKIRVALTVAVTALIHAGVVLGWLNLSPEQEKAIAMAVDVVAGLIIVLWVRPDVTPVLDPRDGAGRPLTPDDGRAGATRMEPPERRATSTKPGTACENAPRDEED